MARVTRYNAIPFHRREIAVRHPQLLICAFDDWLAKQLATLAADSGWLLKETRQTGACLALLVPPRPTVVVAQLDPRSDTTNPLAFLADIHRIAPDAATVVVSDSKLNDDDRAHWTAMAFDLGARYVTFPPLFRQNLEDIVSGLMASRIRADAK